MTDSVKKNDAIDFDRVTIVVVSASQNIRLIIGGLLRELKIKNVETFKNTSRVLENIIAKKIDLLLTEWDVETKKSWHRAY